MGASTPKAFDSRCVNRGRFALDCPNEQIKDEPMFFNSDALFAYENGGPITMSFFESLPPDWQNADVVFDSRVHMLMPGWFPAIPGFHHDDVPRPPIKVGEHFITAGQPDYDNPRYRSEHICGLVNATVAPTLFAIGECVMPAIPDGELIYRAWHSEVERLLSKGELSHRYAEDRTLVEFDCDAFHTGTKAVASGWRWFGRLSRNTERTGMVTNELRRNAQVYLEFPMEGW